MGLGLREGKVNSAARVPSELGGGAGVGTKVVRELRECGGT